MTHTTYNVLSWWKGYLPVNLKSTTGMIQSWKQVGGHRRAEAEAFAHHDKNFRSTLWVDRLDPFHGPSIFDFRR